MPRPALKTSDGHVAFIGPVYREEHLRAAKAALNECGDYRPAVASIVNGLGLRLSLAEELIEAAYDWDGTVTSSPEAAAA